MSKINGIVFPKETAKALPELYIEIVTDRILPGPRGIIASTPRLATKQEIEMAREAHKHENPHDKPECTVFYDESHWMYDHRICGICDEIIAFI